MITSEKFATNISFKTDLRESHSGLSGVFAAAVVSQGFRDMLLHDPEMALKQGYLGRNFALSRDEMLLIISITADSLTDLATQVAQTLGTEVT